MLEILLSADSLDEVTRQFGYLITVSDQDAILADEVRSIREELETRRKTLAEGRRVVAEARALAKQEEKRLKARRAELTALEKDLAALRAAAEVKRAEQEAALNASLQAAGNVKRKIADNERAAQAMASLAAQLQQQASAQQAAIEEARRRAAEEARRAAAEAAAAAKANRPPPPPSASAYGFRWPERSFRITQEWGPTAFQLEPPYNYKGTYYPHFHAGHRLRQRLRHADLLDRAWRRRRFGPAAHAVGLGLRCRRRPWQRHPDLVLAHAAERGRQPGHDRDEQLGHRLRGDHGHVDRLPRPLRREPQRLVGEPAQLPALRAGQASTGVRTEGR